MKYEIINAGLNIELAVPLGERVLIDGATGEPLEVHPSEDASIDRWTRGRRTDRVITPGSSR